jgi:electron transfer flavoprotein alpha subunit
MAERALEGLPDAIFCPSTADGRDVAARISARLDLPVLAGVVGLELSGEGLLASHELFGATVLVKSRLSPAISGVYLLGAKAFAVEIVADQPATRIVVGDLDAGPSDRARVLARTAREHSGPELDLATTVVTGGRGLGEQSSFALIEELAGLLGGAPAATRAVVDAGWVPYAYQVGQTGKTVKPELYLACGVSGATQHLVGMKGSRHVIAINRDAAAPIFKVADLGVIGDVHELLPKLIEALRSLQS